jgi:hypothetical protein
MSDLRTRLEDMRDFCLGEPQQRPHPNNVARLCQTILDREERRAEIVDDIRASAHTLEKCEGAFVNAGRVAELLIGFADQFDGKDDPAFIESGGGAS